MSGIVESHVETTKRTVLVVDDEPTNRQLLKTMREKSGYRVLVAEHVQRALEVIEQVTPEAIVLDFMMPHLDGPAVARRLRARRETRDTPIILLTAVSEEDHVEAAFAGG